MTSLIICALQFFHSLARCKYIYLFLVLFYFSSEVSLTIKIRLFHQFPEHFLSIIFWNRFLFLSISFVCIFKKKNTYYEFFTPLLTDGFSLESEWQQFSQNSRSLFRILADLNNALVYNSRIFPMFFDSANILEVHGNAWKFGITSTCTFINSLFSYSLLERLFFFFTSALTDGL